MSVRKIVRHHLVKFSVHLLKMLKALLLVELQIVISLNRNTKGRCVSNKLVIFQSFCCDYWRYDSVSVKFCYGVGKLRVELQSCREARQCLFYAKLTQFGISVTKCHILLIYSLRRTYLDFLKAYSKF